LKAQGFEIGASVHDADSLSLAKELLRHWGEKLVVPTDVVVASSLRADARLRETSAALIKPMDRIVDLGQESAGRYIEQLRDARTVIWNGPFGYCEQPKFCRGTEMIARAIAERTGKAMTVVGGGDSVPYVEQLGIYNKFSLVSTGGGAMLAFLAGDELPGVKALEA
jgi:3-phosphoglycerate kinase